MDLHGEVKEALGLSDNAATRALGTVFRAVRMTMNAKQFGSIQAAVPAVNEWLKAAPMGGGRTAEMLGIVGPEGLSRSLQELGLEVQQVEALCQMVGRRLAEMAPDVVPHVRKSLPNLTLE